MGCAGIVKDIAYNLERSSAPNPVELIALSVDYRVGAAPFTGDVFQIDSLPSNRPSAQGQGHQVLLPPKDLTEPHRFAR